MLDFKAWQAQQTQPSSGSQMSFTDWQAQRQQTPTDLANVAVSGGDINWQGLYDPVQNYYWDSALGGQTVKTRELLGYGKDNKSLDELIATPNPLASLGEDYATHWEDPAYASQFANYGDWADVNIQDFAGTHKNYFTPVVSTSSDSGPSSSGGIDYSRVDAGALKGNKQFDYLFNRDIDPNQWLTDQGIDLREGTGWRPSEEINATDPYTRALQQTIAPNGKKDLLNRPWHMDADLTGKSKDEIEDYLAQEKNPLGTVAGFLNKYDNNTGNKQGDFYENKAVKDWAEGMDAANPGFVKGLFQSPVGALMLGMVTGGLGLVGSTAGGITAATGGAISGTGATALASGMVGAGSNMLSTGLAGGDSGDILKAGGTGMLSGGLGQYAGNYLNNNFVAPAIGDNTFSQALSQGTVNGTTSALMGGDFSNGFTSGVLNSGVKSLTNNYIEPALGEAFNPEVADWLSKTGGRVLGNVVNGRKNDPASLARMSFTDWLSSQPKP